MILVEMPRINDNSNKLDFPFDDEIVTKNLIIHPIFY